MEKKALRFAAVLALGMFSGCATSERNVQPNIDALNAKVSLLQGQLTAKEDENTRLQSDLRSQQTLLAQSQAEKEMMEERLSNALSKANSKKAAPVSSNTESDLK